MICNTSLALPLSAPPVAVVVPSTALRRTALGAPMIPTPDNVPKLALAVPVVRSSAGATVLATLMLLIVSVPKLLPRIAELVQLPILKPESVLPLARDTQLPEPVLVVVGLLV